MSHSNTTFSSRLRSLPTRLRFLLVVTPLFIYLLFVCVGFVVWDQGSGSQAATATALQQQTQSAVETAQRLEIEQRAAETATAALSARQAAEDATALAAQATVTPSRTPGPTPVATETETSTLFVGTSTPASVTLTLRECRGWDGTVIFDPVPPQSLSAHKTLSFTVQPGQYHLRIDWLGHPEQNVSIQLDLKKDTGLTFGDQC